QDGGPHAGTIKAPRNVYVNQPVNALDSDATFTQVKATTHPFPYDSLCLRGLACDLSSPPGDRSLADFFAIGYNRASGKLSVVFNFDNKKPDDELGQVATPMVVTQTGGPSNGGGTVSPDTRPVVRADPADPARRAIAEY